ncbi:MAG TPA: AbrB/MazE/SpoVT family DNA-binding domain-containing protein [Acidimicrobiales bacterium]|nr:AbrB/MazE/SpoVT family DNA-binding domain-containing protein [Acidimicrobiales bacterium]
MVVGKPAALGMAAYNTARVAYNEAMSEASHVMTVSRNGQVSIPAETRARWNTRQVLVVDLGDRVVMRPVGAEPVGELRGKYAKQGPATSRARRASRRVDTDRPSRR